MAKKESKKGSLILEARGRFVNNKDRRKDCRLDRSTLSGPSRERIGGPVLKEREKERRGEGGETRACPVSLSVGQLYQTDWYDRLPIKWKPATCYFPDTLLIAGGRKVVLASPELPCKTSGFLQGMRGNRDLSRRDLTSPNFFVMIEGLDQMSREKLFSLSISIFILSDGYS